MNKLADKASPEQIIKKPKGLGCKSIAFVYFDPTIFLECVIDDSQAFRNKNIKTVAVTAGYIFWTLEWNFLSTLMLYNIDLNFFPERFYKAVNSGHLNVVFEILEYLEHETEV